MKLREMKLLYLGLVLKSSTTKIFKNVKLPAPLSMKRYFFHKSTDEQICYKMLGSPTVIYL